MKPCGVADGPVCYSQCQTALRAERSTECLPAEIGLRRTKVPIAMSKGAVEAPSSACVREV